MGIQITIDGDKESQEFRRKLDYLLKLPKENEVVEFKKNNKDPDEIGEYISALSNSAALHNEPFGYICWGIEDESYNIVGTSFNAKEFKVGNEELENWLLQKLNPRIDFRILVGEIDGKFICMIEISPANQYITRFKNIGFIRVGSLKKKLKDYPAKEQLLWKSFSKINFESGISVSNIDSKLVLSLLNYSDYFDMTNQSLPDSLQGILSRFESEKFINKISPNNYNITNLGAILFAKNLNNFPNLTRKVPRVIVYEGDSKIKTRMEQTGVFGYAIGFEGLISFINSQLPQNEVIEDALRKRVKLYPEIAIRELVANAIIHQDFSVTGTGPTIEIFADRIEITNPGKPLIDTLRFIDEPPQSRNEALASFLRRVNICEERGSGIDKVIFEVELFQLPAPEFRVTSNHTQVILYAPKKFRNMSKEERIRACYQHACLMYVSRKEMSNATLRERFGISDENYPQVSKVISDAISKGLVKSNDPSNRSRKHAKYVPFWL